MSGREEKKEKTEKKPSKAKTEKPKESSAIGRTVGDIMRSTKEAVLNVISDIGEPIRDLKAGHIGRAILDVPLYALGGSILDITEGVVKAIGAVLGVEFKKEKAGKSFKESIGATRKIRENIKSPIARLREEEGIIRKVVKSLYAVPKDVFWGNLRDTVIGGRDLFRSMTAFELRKDAGLYGALYGGFKKSPSKKPAAAPATPEPAKPAAPETQEPHKPAAGGDVTQKLAA